MERFFLKKCIYAYKANPKVKKYTNYAKLTLTFFKKGCPEHEKHNVIKFTKICNLLNSKI